MKKIIIGFISILYVTAIVIVGFIGIRMEVNPAKIVKEVEYIFLNEIKGDEDGIFEYYYDGSDDRDKLVYAVYSRPKKNQPDPYINDELDGEPWDFGGIKYDYMIRFYNLDFILQNENWINGQEKGTYMINVQVMPENSTVQEVSYYTSSDEIIFDEGLITFAESNKGYRFDMNIMAADNSGTKIYIRFLID